MILLFFFFFSFRIVNDGVCKLCVDANFEAHLIRTTDCDYDKSGYKEKNRDGRIITIIFNLKDVSR